MRAGRLDRRIELQSKTETRDSFGAAIPTWTAYTTVWAEVKSEGQAGARNNEADTEQSRSERVFKIRYGPIVEPEHRVLHDGLTYRIKAVNEISRREGLELRTERYEDDA